MHDSVAASIITKSSAANTQATACNEFTASQPLSVGSFFVLLVIILEDTILALKRVMSDDHHVIKCYNRDRLGTQCE